MRKTIRFGVVALAAAVALALAGQALASYAPKLVVQMGSAGTTIKLSIPPADDPTAQLTFFAPAGTGANLSASAGTTIGVLDAKAAAGALGGATLPLTGTVQARAADGTYLSSGQQVPLAAAAQRCTGTATHAAYWVLALTAAGQTLEVPLFVDPVSAAPLSMVVGYSLKICLPPSDIPEPQGGAAFGAKVFEANFTVKGVFSPTASGANLWRVVGTPYNPGVGTPNTAATVEAQSYVETGSVSLGTPVRTLTKTSATFRASGTAKVGGLPDTVATVALARGTTAAKQTTAFAHPALAANGTFTAKFAFRRAKRAQTLYVKATLTAPQRDLPATDCKATFGVPCIGATAGGFASVSGVRKIVVPAAPAKR
jgi:hypothetical protein